ncbi:MAG: endolytic transglycosylase MltG [Candidatus Obscuribacterales bacterium]|nr:endolytic transglycosylase MltG [Candidatus Obscuribacterales bacterium]
MSAIRVILLACFIICLCLLGSLAWVAYSVFVPLEHEKSQEIINIPQGSSSDEIVEKLQDSKIIRNPMIFKLYLKAKHAGPLIKAGDYLFKSPISSDEVLAELETGGLIPNKFTIIEGWTRWDIANAMAASQTFKLKNAEQALKLMNDTRSIADLSTKAKNLEGFMFPDTYSVYSTTTAKDVIDASVKRFHQVWNEKIKERARDRKQSALEVVTIASIIETEAKLSKERPLVASVIYNRLSRNINLSVDSTIVYASKLAGKWKNNGIVYLSDVNRESPYNTRRVAGLPPGPVGNPGLASLLAAVNPVSSSYIFYVRDPAKNDGTHNFYSDASGFEKGVQALRNWEKARDAAKTQNSKNTAAKRRN